MHGDHPADQRGDFRSRYIDESSSAAEAAAASIDKANAAMDRGDVSVQKAAVRTSSVLKQWDDQAKAAANLQRILASLEAAKAGQTADAATGGDKAESYARSIANLSAAAEQGKAKLESLRSGTTAAADGSKAASAEVRNMGIQFVQAFSGIATGQPILTTFLQQGHQVLDVALSSGQGLKSLGGAFSSMLAPIGGFATILGVGAVGALGAFEIAANNNLGRLADIRTALRGTQENYSALAGVVEEVGRRVGASTSLTIEAATKAAQTIQANKLFSGTSTDLERLTRDAASFGRVMGGDAALGAQKLSEGMSDTLKTAQALASGPNGLRTLDSKALELIESFQTAGDRSKAFAVLLNAVETASQNAAQDVSPLSKAWTELTNQFVDSNTKGHTFTEWLANDLANAIKGVTEGIVALKAAMTGLNGIQDTILGAGRAFVGNTPQTTSGSSASPGGYAELRNQVAALVGIDAEALRRVQEHEGLYKDGQWQVSSSGAKGPMQLLPGTFDMMQRQYKFSGTIDDEQANTLAGAYYLRQGLQASKGDLGRAYLGYHDGNGILQSGATPSQAALTTSQSIASGYNGQALVNISPEMVSNAKALNSEINDLAKNSLAVTNARMDEQIRKNDAALIAEAASGGTDSTVYRGLVQAQDELIAKRARSVDAQTAATRAEESGLRATQGQTAAEQALNAAIEKRRQIAYNTGSPFGSAEEQAAVNNVLASQSQAYDRLTTSMANTTANSYEMAQAYGKGNQAVIDATAKQQAYDKALEEFPRNSPQFAAAFNELTGYYKQAALGAAELAVQQQNASSRDNLAYINEETQSIGMNSDARDKLLATMRAQQEMHRKFGDILPQEAQDYIALASATVEAQAHLSQMQNSFNDFQNIGVNAFNQVGDAIVEAMASGGKKTLDFGDIFRDVMASIIKQIMQLAVINPILNSVFGGNRSTLSSALDAFGSNGLASGFGGAANDNFSFDGAGFNGTGDASFDGGGISMPGGSQGIMNAGSAVYNIGSLVWGGGGSAAGTSIAAATDAAFGGAGITAAADGTVALGEAGATGATLTTIGTATSAISSAIPYIGAAVGIISDLAKGNYAGAGLMAGGAAIGTMIFPGIGTAIGAALGGVISSFLPNHPKHPYQTTGVNVEDGRLTQGDTSSQLEDASGAISAVHDFNAGINKYLDSVHLLISNANGRIGGVGNGVTGFEQVDDPSKLFQTLSFRPDANAYDPNGNFFKAASGALDQTKFMTPQELQDQLGKVAQFSDGLDTFGIKLGSVGQRLLDIKIDSVLNPTGNDFRTALAHDLPGQTFHTTDDFMAEIQKVNQFVNGTIPSLLHPVLDTTSDLQKQIQAMIHTYADAIDQAQKYGLATDGLTAAQGKAVAMLQASAIQDLAASNVDIARRGAVARGQDTSPYDLQAFDIGADKQREALKQQYLNIYGSLIPDATEYGAALKTLDQTLADERLAIVNKGNGSILQSDQSLAQSQATLIQKIRGEYDAQFSVLDKFNSIRARQSAAMGDPKDADLLNFDDAAQKERVDYQRQLADYYGASFLNTKDYTSRMSELETVLGEERLAIIKKYGEQGNDASAQALETARGNVGNVITSLADYAKSLQTGADSPLSARGQYDLAKNQFQAVASAADAGDYNSAQKLQSYAQSFLSASRGVNGSGTKYAGDYQQVLAALAGVTTQSDALTNSAMAETTKTQTTALSAKFDELKAELVALRREYQQQARAA